jgi:hypothetical protein
VSEYQYCEFQTVDRPLTEDEQAEISKLSRRVELTRTQAVFTYQFGDFPKEPEEVLERYFDAMLYLANWGTRRLMFRFPQSLIDLKQVRPYEVEDVIEFRHTDDHAILDIHFNEEGVSFWVEGEGQLSSLVRLRDDLLRQDYRLLYLAWLKAISLDTLDDSEVEPPVPPGLSSLSAALRNFVDLVDIDPHLIAVAAKASAEQETLPEDELYQAIGQLSRDECESYLRQLLQGEPQLAIALRARLQQLVGLPPSIPTGQRTVKQLLGDAEREREREEAERAREGERKQLAALEALAQREDAAWQEVETLLQKYTAQNYQEAVQLISRLREVAVYRETETVFQTRLNSVYERYRTRHSLLNRLRAAGLHPA